jgi:putative oxidoreductase
MGLLALKPSRLYSRFPGGSVGLALLVLRLVDGLGLVGEGVHLLTPVGTSSEHTSVLLLGLAIVATAVMLILGMRTSFAGNGAAICTAGAALYGSHHLNLLGSEMDARLSLFALVFFLSGALALLGPGGYSLDARLFGWRIIKLSSRQSSSKDAD